jgi:hypothetical protein
MSKIQGKSILSGKLECYHGDDDRILLQAQKLWGISPGARGSQNLFLTKPAKTAA